MTLRRCHVQTVVQSQGTERWRNIGKFVNIIVAVTRVKVNVLRFSQNLVFTSFNIVSLRNKPQARDL